MKNKFKSRSFLCAVFFCGIYSFFLYSQQIEPVFRNYSIHDGLPGSEIYTVIQDSKGYLWFGTDNGVSRFDGYKFKNYGLRDGLSDNTVFKIFEDTQGRIWFGTYSCKLSYFFNDSIYPFTYNRQLADTLPQNSIITSFYVDSKNNVFLGLNADGCFKISKEGKIAHFNPAMKHQESGSAYIMEIDSVLFSYGSADLPGNQKERIILIPEQKKLKTTFDLNNKLVARWNLCAIKSKNKICYIALSNNLIIVEDSLHESLVKHPEEIICLYEDNLNNIWIGYYKGGAVTIKSENCSRSFSFLENMSVSSILQDHEGGYWFTTLERGVFYVPDISIRQFPLETKLSNIPANTLCNDGNGHVFVGLQDGSIYALSAINYQVTGTVNISTKNNTYQIMDFLFAPPSKLWVGSAGNFNAVHKKQFLENLQIIPLPCSKIVLNDGSIWGAQYNGISRFNDQQLIYQSVNSESPIRVNTLLPDSLGNFWIGSMDGLWKFQSEKFQYYGNKNHLLQYDINDIKNSVQGLLLATEGAGLVIMNNDSVYCIDQKDGLLNTDINSIFIDSNEIVWLATKEGVSNIIFKENFTYIQNVTNRFGLNEQEVTDVIINGKDILIAGKTGLKIIKDYKKETAKIESPVFITDVQINHNDTSRLSSYELPYYLNSIGIGYKGISYKHTQALEYKYRMIGIDSGWHSTSNLSVQYPTLAPGEYLFEVTVAGNPGSENKVAFIGFIINSPFWKTWWFITGLAAVFISLTVLSVYLRIRQLLNRGKLLQELNAAHHKALSAQMNPHFIFNSLNSIHTYILQNKTEDSSKYLTKFSSLMRMVLENSMENMIPVEQEIKALELYLELEAMRFKGKITWSMEMDESLDPGNIKVPPLLLQPYVENAVWHGLMHKQGNGTIKVILKRTGLNLLCIIEDDGIGRLKSAEIKREKSMNNNSAGTNITEKRIALINSVHNISIGVSTDDLQDENRDPCGTRVTVMLPLIS